MANPWLRLYTEFATDAKVQMMSEAMQRRLIMLFCLQGSCQLPATDEEVAFLLRLSMDEMQKTKALFTKNGFIHDDWALKNWDKRQFKSDFSKERTKKWRENGAGASPLAGSDGQPPSPKRPSDAPEQNRDRTEAEQKQNRKRGTRIAEDWRPTDADILFCQTQRPDLDVSALAGQFHDHWLAKDGDTAIKRDWSATWRNWVRNEKPGKPSTGNGGTKRVVL